MNGLLRIAELQHIAHQLTQSEGTWCTVAQSRAKIEVDHDFDSRASCADLSVARTGTI